MKDIIIFLYAIFCAICAWCLEINGDITKLLIFVCLIFITVIVSYVLGIMVLEEVEEVEGDKK